MDIFNINIEEKITAKAEAFAVKNPAKKVYMLGVRPTCTPFFAESLAPAEHIQEKVLLDAFGDEYRTFICHTWRLIPGWSTGGCVAWGRAARFNSRRRET